ncbi:SIR2 family protein [Bartonella apis]|uniref:SIR2 family protein n=1 Tax=Bartonella apis TaxID=1686310 RepID=UPI0024327AF9|nr:SIR2 family protein [Bartonella apis]
MAQIKSIKHVGTISELVPFFQSGRLNFLLGAGASTSFVNVLGNVERKINNFLAKNNELEAFKEAYKFIKEIICADQKFIDSGDKNTEIKDYKEFLENIDKILFERKTSILPRQANIFSTNYDLFVEYAADLLPNIVLNDGFVRSYALNNRLVYKPEVFFDRRYRGDGQFEKYAEIPTINLIKLHGSLSWGVQDNEVYFTKPILPELDVLENCTSKNCTSEIKDHLKKIAVILPIMSKFHDTLFERIYYESFRILSKSMDSENAVLISFGFSFNDEHILDIVRRSLRNPTAQLIIFSYSYESSLEYQKKFEGQRNVLIYRMADEKEKINFSRFNQILGSLVIGKNDE